MSSAEREAWKNYQQDLEEMESYAECNEKLRFGPGAFDVDNHLAERLHAATCDLARAVASAHSQWVRARGFTGEAALKAYRKSAEQSLRDIECSRKTAYVRLRLDGPLNWERGWLDTLFDIEEDQIAQWMDSDEEWEDESSVSEGSAVVSPELPKRTGRMQPPRKPEVIQFLNKAQPEVGFKLMPEHFWRAANYSERTLFQKWQTNSPQCTKEARDSFERVLTYSPREFLDALSRLGWLKPIASKVATGHL